MPVITIKKNNTYTADEVFQWNTGNVLEIYGLTLPDLPEIHFAKSGMVNAIVKQAASYDNGVIRVAIPNFLLETATPINVYICGYEDEAFISRYSLTIKVKPRPKPEDYFAEDDEKIYSYNALENLVNNTVINLKSENVTFREEMLAEFEQAINQIKAEVQDIINNTVIANADTLDGFNAEEFEFSTKPGKTVFNSDGSITTTYSDGSSETIVFNNDGSITTTRNTLELGVKTEITKFNADGSITVTAS